MNLGERRTVKKQIAVVAGAVVTILIILYFSKLGPFQIVKPKSAQAQVHQHGAPLQFAGAGQDKSMPGMAPEKPATKEVAPEQAVTEAPTVEIPKDKQQLIGVKTAIAQVQPLVKDIRTVGLVGYDERRLNTINTKIEGWVEKLYVNFTETYVRKGEPIADIYSPELWATQQEFINMVKWAKHSRVRTEKVSADASDGPDIGSMIDKDAQSLVDAARERLKLWDISASQIRKIEESEEPIRTLTIYSPYSGYVLQKYVNQGSRVMPGEKLFDLADFSNVWITADIYEFELPFVKVGDAAVVQLSYLPGRQFSTRIDYIYPVLEGETRTEKARFSIPNQGGLLKPQMFTNVDLKIGLGRRLAVPADAVINTGVRRIAYVDKGDGNFEPREVLTGVQTENLVEITAGLKAGDRVASSANFLIDSEAKLKGVEPLPQARQQASTPQAAPERQH
jgi:Cu(I)/Ag(I) efflux system membrane fusion protein